MRLLVLMLLMTLLQQGSSKGKTSKAGAKPHHEVVGLLHDEYTCSRCKWTAKALRAALGAKKFPRRPKDSSKRFQLTGQVLDQNSTDLRVCSKQRFPERFKVLEARDSVHVEFVDGNERPPENGGIRLGDVVTPMDVIIDGMVSACDLIMSALRDELPRRASEFTQHADEFTINTAFTDRWLCHRTTGICPSNMFRERDADEQDDEAEL
eukprot:TRINITY_DN31499_c0_g1_i1.p1 TRINITY_DN31499_c0_g1~~TRINITY_DN31499_c0_g1_i1.p1  ORF type:complete len:209 (+),score=31.96 TRINITY_DN31499_c0_g1_i1:50-676(+)